MADVFISFVHEDQAVAQGVQQYVQHELSLVGKVFLSSDHWQIFAGELWLDRIKQELSQAKVVILMLSKRSVVRPWVNFEAGAAWLSNKPIVPVCYGNMDKAALPKPYSGIQALNLPQECNYLADSVAHHLGVSVPMRNLEKLAELANPPSKDLPGDRMIRALRVNAEPHLRSILEQFRDD